ncbi:hypothetical protein BCV70DRAFT_198620 [Testicularia cyperi]|uniref:Transcription factor IIIC subunit 5 HTH domain-containing protein n=1 Tax=Testicularia cyperi TaxID=1882483 RepID=A0A317XVL0_9BASI|nr:hypothetical protein BCV70DRAFT_198620 [Testicularia cyperi]
MSVSRIDKGKAKEGLAAADVEILSVPAAQRQSPSITTSHTTPGLDPTVYVWPQSIPSTALLNIEYPGIISNDDASDVQPGNTHAGPSSRAYSPLDRALSSLHPSPLPPATSTPHNALSFLSRIHNDGMRIVECRLGSYAQPPLLASQEESDPAGNDCSSRHRARQVDSAFEDLYRSPVIGETVDTHNIVIRIVKRTWRQKRRAKSTSPSSHQHSNPVVLPDDELIDPALDPALDPSLKDSMDIDTSQQSGPPTQSKLQTDRYTGRIKREYRVEVVGVATKTVRFRSMADFAYQPDTSAPPPSSASDSASASTSSASTLDPVMALHGALATMDLEYFKQFQIPEQKEDYQVAGPDGKLYSNVGMIPPAFFSRQDIPFTYGFQQTPYSEIRTVPRPPHMSKLLQPMASWTTPIPDPKDRHNGEAHVKDVVLGSQMQRYVNKVRLSNIAPQPFRLGRDTTVPVHPLPEVLRIEGRCEPEILSTLREILDQRPVWSRMAFKNQLSPQQLQLIEGTNGKVYFALVGYAMVGGPWRDTIVRFGYDARHSRESRFYQRLFLRSAGNPSSASSAATRTRDRLADATADISPSRDGSQDPDGEARDSSATAATSSTSRIQIPKTLGNRTRSTAQPRDAKTAPVNEIDESRGKHSHVFDGTTLNRTIGNFQLCDITDPLIRPFIDRRNDDDDDDESDIHTLNHVDSVENGDESNEQSRPRPHRAQEHWGIEWLRADCDPETGWYTRRALDLIRALVAARFKSLAETSTPLAAHHLDNIVLRFRRKWAEEDAASANANADTDSVDPALTS